VGVLRGSQQEKKILAAGLVPLYIPPDVARAMQRGQKVYNIKYISPASRIMKTEELQGLTQAMDITIGIGQAMPEMADNFDADVIARKVHELCGIDEEVLRDTKTIQSIREARARMQEQQQQLMQAQAASDINMKMSQATSMREGAISGRPRG
jgi:hypothetical protein